MNRERQSRGQNHASTTSPVSVLRLGRSRYDVLERISLPERGRWLVRDHRPPPAGTRYVAILRPDDPGSRQLHRTLRRLPEHAGALPSLVDQGWVDGQFCVVVRWWKGIDLEQYLQRLKKGRSVWPSPTECVRLIRGLVHGVRFLHERCQVVHGDLKPSNLILTMQPSSLRMIDFGSSWQIDRTRDRVPGDGSDPTFSAPELLDLSRPVTESVDQFSVGVILYLLLTQRLPFEGLGGRIGQTEVREELTAEDLVPISPSHLIHDAAKIPRAILDEIDQLTVRMLQPEPAERFVNSKSWCRAIDRLHLRVQSASHAETTTDPLYRFGKRLLRGLSWFRGNPE